MAAMGKSVRQAIGESSTSCTDSWQTLKMKAALMLRAPPMPGLAEERKVAARCGDGQCMEIKTL